MSLVPVYTKQFEKDLKRCQRRNKRMEKFKLVAETLIAGDELDSIHRDHKLIGNFVGRRECHLESDWLLIYKLEEDRIIFERMGSHADLF
ncbi:MAG: type II toxin-antitoxin system mRNA interferase toxin, RelE/StbE family [Opitutae bacterium]|nr:type II toxin-antitoxin system mRNA interferase toxin, RelE/StbE family [Opitutae bacterium]|tara:strand:- start:120 stop:389 length:270 start_codon:yes stop_codon:yes gene_type:complete